MGDDASPVGVIGVLHSVVLREMFQYGLPHLTALELEGEADDDEDARRIAREVGVVRKHIWFSGLWMRRSMCIRGRGECRVPGGGSCCFEFTTVKGAH